MENIWEKTKTSIKGIIPLHSYKMWIEPLEFKRDDNNYIILTCPNYFSKKRVQEHYSSLVEKELAKILGNSCKVSYEIAEKNQKKKEKKTKIKHSEFQLCLPNMRVQSSTGRLLRKDFTFDRFIVGNNNDFAFSAALSLACKKDTGRNSLYLLSDTGLGKSHLSQAIGHHILSRFPSDRVYYITAEDFANEMISAFKNDSIEIFKERYRNQCDVLILEDIHFLTGKNRTQIELALALDYLLNAQKKIIFTSCYLPGDIPKMNEQLRSRLCCGMIPKIDPPDFRTRTKILKVKADEKKCNIPPEVVEYLASELNENVRQLESGLIGVSAKSSLLGAPIDLNLAQSVVKNITRSKKKINIDSIKKLICKHYNISVEDIVSRSRKQSIAKPRHIAIYLSRKYTDQTLQAIGRSFNRYHATALRSIGTVKKAVEKDVTIRKQVAYFCEKLESGNF